MREADDGRVPRHGGRMPRHGGRSGGRRKGIRKDGGCRLVGTESRNEAEGRRKRRTRWWDQDRSIMEVGWGNKDSKLLALEKESKGRTNRDHNFKQPWRQAMRSRSRENLVMTIAYTRRAMRGLILDHWFLKGPKHSPVSVCSPTAFHLLISENVLSTS